MQPRGHVCFGGCARVRSSGCRGIVGRGAALGHKRCGNCDSLTGDEMAVIEAFVGNVSQNGKGDKGWWAWRRCCNGERASAGDSQAAAKKRGGFQLLPNKAQLSCCRDCVQLRARSLRLSARHHLQSSRAAP